MTNIWGDTGEPCTSPHFMKKVVFSNFTDLFFSHFATKWIRYRCFSGFSVLWTRQVPGSVGCAGRMYKHPLHTYIQLISNVYQLISNVYPTECLKRSFPAMSWLQLHQTSYRKSPLLICHYGIRTTLQTSGLYGSRHRIGQPLAGPSPPQPVTQYLGAEACLNPFFLWIGVVFCWVLGQI